jgi:homopolymeric O-antigen transport system permease protein
MTATTPEGIANGNGSTSARVAELFGQHGAADLPFVPFIVASEGPVEVVDYRPSPFAALVEAWRYRAVGAAVFRSVLWRYLSAPRLGPTWLVVQSLMSMVGFALIFGGGVFNVKTPSGMPYILYSMVGMMGWQLFMQTMFMSMRGFQRVKLVQDFHMPLLWVPIIGSAAGLLRSVISMVFYAGFVTYFSIADGRLYLQLSPRLLAISAAGLGLCLMLAWGMGMWVTPLYAWATDTRYVIRLLMPFWMFMTPVLYPTEHLHGTMRVIGDLNPLTAPIEMTKVGLLGAGSVNTLSMLTSFPLIFAVFISGVWFITRFGQRLAGLRTDDGLDDDAMQDDML